MSRRRSGKAKQTKKSKQEQATKCHRQQPSSMSINPEIEKEDDENQKVKGGGRRFFGCYLLTSLCPRFKGHTYIGFTVNPMRRIRQHNGEITSGAFRTKKKRPWEMVLCIHGFPTNVAALQFEWAWQHPRESVAVREAAASFKTLGGLANKIKLALTMLTLHCWQSMNLTISFFSTKYMTHAAGCPSLPHQMKLHFCSMDELPCYGNNDHLNSFDDEDDVNSNDSEFCANDSDERLESSTCDSMESDNISCAIKSATDNALVGDHLVFGCPLEHESSSMAGTLEEHMEPSHQFPVDVNGSTMNISNELSRPCDEIWIEDDQNSFRVFEEHRQPIAGVHASENELMMVSQEILPSCQSPADVPAPTENDLNEHLRLGEESTIKELRDSFPIIEETVLSFEHAGPSERQQSSMVDFVSVVENPAKKDNITCIIIDDITEEQSLPTRVPSPIRFVKHVRACKNKGMEVIDLCTPSPEFRITTGSKKRRVISDFPDLIDLTASPSVVQL